MFLSISAWRIIDVAGGGAVSSNNTSFLIDGLVSPVVRIGENIRPISCQLTGVTAGAGVAKKDSAGVVLRHWKFAGTAQAFLKSWHD